MNPELASMFKEQLDAQDKNNNFSAFIYEALIALSNELELYLSVRTPNRLDIGDFYQQDFYLVLELDKTGLIVAYFVFRTNSILYDGERTDLHDCQSILFSLCCAMNNSSISLWNISNDFSEIEEELYGRYATVSQPNCSVITQDEIGLENIKSILAIYKDYQDFILPYKCQSSKKKSYAWDLEEIHSQCNLITTSLNLSQDEVVGNRRLQPDWDYFQIYSQKISILKSSIANRMLTGYIEETYKTIDQLTDEQNTYFKLGTLKHCFSKNDIEQIMILSKALNNGEVKIIASESHIFAISGDWILAKQGNFGFERFNVERDNFSKSVLKKVNYLYENPVLEWNKKGCPERFENLCRELLAREELVSRVRKVSPTNQPDRSRDLIVEIIDYKPIDQLVGQQEQPLSICKYLVQCKLSKNTLGIPKGMGPFEALYLGDYDGYFLITNAVLSSDHTALLEKLRSDKKYNADWWTKEEIEERLKNNIDLLHEYEDLVSYIYPKLSKADAEKYAAY